MTSSYWGLFLKVNNRGKGLLCLANGCSLSSAKKIAIDDIWRIQMGHLADQESISMEPNKTLKKLVNFTFNNHLCLNFQKLGSDGWDEV